MERRFKNVYIINDFTNSPQNGVGTFLNIMHTLLVDNGYNIYIIDFNTTEKIFCIKRQGDIKYFCFPFFPTINFNRYHIIIDKFIRFYIEDSINNIFLFNYSPCGEMIKCVKEYYPHSTLIYIIHNLSWSEILLGDLDKLKWIIERRDQDNIKEQYASLLHGYEEEKQTYMSADKIVCLCEDTQNLLTCNYSIDKNKLFLISNGISLNNQIDLFLKEELKKEKFVFKEEMVLLFVGRLSLTKGVYALLESFDLVLNEYPECKLVLAGDSCNYQDFFAFAKKSIARITLLGHVNKKELESWYKIADIGIIPSYTEQCMEKSGHAVTAFSQNKVVDFSH